ncbi:hypothetical protein [Iodobacter fluviatilis]|nr:hypothetical protein [Iodobacter fluviatilis]QBC45838.1 hypothetical protein C1H71_20050 [Iodobacter fluviatilis]
MSFHNFASGKRDKNPWGQAVLLTESASKNAVYINFHSTKVDEDSEDKKPLAHTMLNGASGTGKTVLLSTLYCNSQKYELNSPDGFSTVVFDKDRGMELVCRANDAEYFRFLAGEPTGINPFQGLEPTPANLEYLNRFVAGLVTDEANPVLFPLEEQQIDEAVRSVMDMPKHLRRLTTLSQNITEGGSKEDKQRSLVRRLEKWLYGNRFGFVFDNPKDTLDFNISSNIAFDGTEFVNNKNYGGLLAEHLIYRMESIIDGRRFQCYMDEFWQFLQHPQLQYWVFDKLKTIRKRNGVMIFATQSPEDYLDSEIAPALIQQCATQILLPNPRANRDQYVNGLKLTSAEYDLVSHFGEDSRQFLYKQQHLSTVCRMNYGREFDRELSILSGSADLLPLMDEAISERGKKSDLWLPRFYELRKQHFGR